MKKYNGFTVAARLCHCSMPAEAMSFPEVCKFFGTLYWDDLSCIEKSYFKRLALQYNQSEAGIAYRNGAQPKPQEFIIAVFDQAQCQKEEVMKQLRIVAYDLVNMHCLMIAIYFRVEGIDILEGLDTSSLNDTVVKYFS